MDEKVYDHIVGEAAILDQLRATLPMDASVEEKQRMRAQAAAMAAEATRRRVGRLAAEKVLNVINLPVARMRSATANGRPMRDTTAARRRGQRKK